MKNWGKSIVVESMIGHQTEITGDLRFSGGLHINGRVRGRVLSSDKDASLSIGATGLIEGDVYVPQIMIQGHVKGNVYASQRVALGARARVIGDLYYKTLEMTAGAKVMGQLVLREDVPIAERLPAPTPQLQK